MNTSLGFKLVYFGLLVLSFHIIFQSGNAQQPPDCVGGFMPVYYNYTFDQCRFCHSSCKSCSGETAYNCTNCTSPSSLFNNTCVSKCPDNFYNNSETRECLPCSPACNKTCKGSGPFNCTDCEKSNQTKLENGTCVEPCQIGRYFSLTDKKCNLCRPECLLCNGPTANNCTLCAGGLFLLTDPQTQMRTCRISCPDGFFKNYATGTCDKCDKNCMNCNDRTAFNCTSCPVDRALRTDSQCGNCTTGTFFLNSTGNCENCDISCASCNGTSFSCISCRNASFYKENGVCLKCPVGCRTCVNSTFCSSCDEGFLKKNNYCSVDCSTIFFQDVSPANMDCHPCDTNLYYDFQLSTCVERHYCLATGSALSLKGDEDDLAKVVANNELRVCNYVPPVKQGRITPILLIVPLTIIGFILCLIWCLRVIKWVFKPYTMVDPRLAETAQPVEPPKDLTSHVELTSGGGTHIPLIITKEDIPGVKSNIELINEGLRNKQNEKNEEEPTGPQIYKKKEKEKKPKAEAEKTKMRGPTANIDTGRETEDSNHFFYDDKPVSLPEEPKQFSENKVENKRPSIKEVISEEAEQKREIAHMMIIYKNLLEEYKEINIDLDKELPRLGTPKKERFLLVKQPIKTEYEVSQTFKNELNKKPVSLRYVQPSNVLSNESDIAKMSLSHFENIFKGYQDFVKKYEHKYLTDLKGIGTKVETAEGAVNLVLMQERFKNDFDLILYEKKHYFSYEETLQLALNVVSAIQALHDLNTPYANFNIANVFYHTNRKIAKLATLELYFDYLNRNHMASEGIRFKFPKMYAYEAPEQITKEDLKKEDTPVQELRKDIWGLGVILHEMFYHRKPNIPWVDNTKEEYFKDNKKKNESMARLATKYLSKNPKFVAADPELPEQLESLIADCLKPDPNKRIDIYELKDRLNKISQSPKPENKAKAEDSSRSNHEEGKRTQQTKPAEKVTQGYEREEPVNKFPEVRRESLPPVRRFEGGLPDIPRQFNEGYRVDFPSESRNELKMAKAEQEGPSLGSFTENFNSDNQEDETLIKKTVPIVRQGSNSKQDAFEQKKLAQEHFSPESNNLDFGFTKKKNASAKQDLIRPTSTESQLRADIQVASFNNSRAFMKNESGTDYKHNEDFFPIARNNMEDVMVVEEFDDYKIDHKKEDEEEEFAMF